MGDALVKVQLDLKTWARVKWLRPGCTSYGTWKIGAKWMWTLCSPRAASFAGGHDSEGKKWAKVPAITEIFVFVHKTLRRAIILQPQLNHTIRARKLHDLTTFFRTLSLFNRWVRREPFDGRVRRRKPFRWLSGYHAIYLNYDLTYVRMIQMSYARSKQVSLPHLLPTAIVFVGKAPDLVWVNGFGD